MVGTCRLNNKSMRNFRRDPLYQTIMVDLMLLGKISEKECEELIGSGVPNGLMLPGAPVTVAAPEPEKPAKKTAKKAEEPVEPVSEE